jgi:hypothetical protein
MFAIGAALDVGPRAERLFANEQPPSSVPDLCQSDESIKLPLLLLLVAVWRL